jgi:rSAM/selenodomain-associated transferase 1
LAEGPVAYQMGCMSRRVLGLFAKLPVAGQVKTRLAAATSPEWAASVAAAFLADLIERFASCDAQRVLVYAPREAASYFTGIAADRFACVPQCLGNLGQRMLSFVRDQLDRGAESILIVGTDSPTLPLGFLEQAFYALEQADIVLGPATDGGYYLVGCTRRIPPIFDDIAWSSAKVLAETVARLVEPSWRLALLPPWYDVDTLDDWRMLCGHLAALRRAGSDPGVPRTEHLCQASQP